MYLLNFALYKIYIRQIFATFIIYTRWEAKILRFWKYRVYHSSKIETLKLLSLSMIRENKILFRSKSKNLTLAVKYKLLRKYFQGNKVEAQILIIFKTKLTIWLNLVWPMMVAFCNLKISADLKFYHKMIGILIKRYLKRQILKRQINAKIKALLKLEIKMSLIFIEYWKKLAKSILRISECKILILIKLEF